MTGKETGRLDQDRQAVVDRLRAAIASSGLTQKEFAKAIGTSPSRLSAYLHGDTTPAATLLMRAQRIGASLSAARAESVPTPTDAATSLRRALAAGQRPSNVLRLAIETRDRLRDTLENRPHLADAWDAQPSTGDKHWDTLFAAIVEREFTNAHRAAPAWTSRCGPLDAEWFPARGRQGEEEIRSQTPLWLRSKNILLSELALSVA